MSEPSGDLLDDLALSFLRPGPAGAGVLADEPLFIEYSRDLTPEDIVILNTVPVGTKAKPIQQLRYSHHMLARLIASGKTSEEAAAITGHAASRVNLLRSQDPAFMELVAHYKDVQSQQFLDAAGRLAVLGTTAVEILQERLEDSPEKFAVRELKEVAEMAFDRSVAPAKGSSNRASGPAAQSGVTVNVSFVSPKAPAGDEQPVIDVTPTPQLESSK